MTRYLLRAGCVALFSLTMFAQTAADPISGNWAGEITREGAAKPDPITLQLKFDGKSAVTGEADGLGSPADVKTGTFDPKTGALKLQFGKKGDTNVRVTLEGTLARGSATGRVTGQGTGEFKITKK